MEIKGSGLPWNSLFSLTLVSFTVGSWAVYLKSNADLVSWTVLPALHRAKYTNQMKSKESHITRVSHHCCWYQETRVCMFLGALCWNVLCGDALEKKEDGKSSLQLTAFRKPLWEHTWVSTSVSFLVCSAVWLRRLVPISSMVAVWFCTAFCCSCTISDFMFSTM